MVISRAKLKNKCLNVRERMEVAEWNKRWSRPFPYCPVSRQCPLKKTLIEGKKNFFNDSLAKLKPYGNDVVIRKLLLRKRKKSLSVKVFRFRNLSLIKLFYNL